MRFTLFIISILMSPAYLFSQDKGIVLEMWIENETFYNGNFGNTATMELALALGNVQNGSNNIPFITSSETLFDERLILYNSEYDFTVNGMFWYLFRYGTGGVHDKVLNMVFALSNINIICYSEGEEFIIPKEQVISLDTSDNFRYPLGLGFNGAHFFHFDGVVKGRWRYVNVKEVEFPTQQEITLCESEAPLFLIANEGCTWKNTNNTNAFRSVDPTNYLYLETAANNDYHLECSGSSGCETLFKVRYSEPLEEAERLGGIQVLCPGQELHLSAPNDMRDFQWYRLVPSDNPSCPIYTKECVSFLKDVNIRSQGLYVSQFKASDVECTYYDTFQVVRSHHVAQITPNIAKVCEQDAQVTLSLGNEGAFENYIWSDMSTSSSVTTQQPGIYWITATDTLGCVSEGIAEVELNCGTGGEGSLPGLGREVVFLDKSEILIGQELELQSGQSSIASGVDKYSAEVILQYHRNSRTELTHNDWTYQVEYEIGYGSQLKKDTLLINNLSDKKIYLSSKRYAHNSVTHPDYHLEILSITSTGVVPDDINIELVSMTERYPLIPNGHLVAGFNQYYDGTTDRIQYSWQPSAYAYGYEIELAWLDKYLENQSSLTAQEIFTQYGFNVQTKENNYTLDITFPEGKLYARVRPIGRFGLETGEIKFGDWSSYIIHQIEDGFEDSLSWQKVVTFAEDGLKKEVVTYYDQVLKPRQVVTGLNSEEISLVAETFYDHEGRGVMQSLPAPVEEVSLKYRSNFNVNASNQSITKLQVDAESQLPFNTASGAALYYHLNNPFRAYNDKFPNIDWIPQANGFVSTLARYRNDNTGKVSRQSGIGELYSLDADEEHHYTTYFYGSSSPTELHRLFGSNVGKARFYSKMMTLDPNGQASISYTDMYGRTIATGLSGSSPFNLAELESKQAIPIRISLDENNVKDRDRRLSAIYHDILNPPSPTTYTFSYSTGGMINTLGPPFNTCTTCEYVLKIKVTDPKGVAVPLTGLYTSSTSQTEYKEENTLLEAYLDNHGQDCSDNTIGRDSIVFSAIFNKSGNYTVSKELYISENSIEGLMTNISVLPGVQSWEDYLEENIVLDTLQCAFTCTDFQKQIIRDSLGFYDAENPVHSTWLNDLVNSNCNYSGIILENANTYAVNECYSYLEQMRFEMSPGGKFFENKEALLTHVTTDLFVVDTLSLIGIDVNELNISNVDSVITSIWTDELAEALVKYHPEYCHYDACLSDTAARKFTYMMAAFSTKPEAAVNQLWEQEDLEAKDPMYGEYEHIFETFKTFSKNGNSYTLGLYDAVDPNFSIPGVYSTTDDVYKDININDEMLMDTLVYSNFRSFLLYVRDSIMAEKRETGGCLFSSDSTPVVRDPRISKQSAYSNLENEVNEINDESCINSCDIYAYNQYRRILVCMSEDISEDSSAIVNYLKSVCLGNCENYVSYTGIPDDEQYENGILDPVLAILSEYDTICSIRETLKPGFRYEYVIDSMTQDTMYQEICGDSIVSIIGGSNHTTALYTLVSVFSDLLNTYTYDTLDALVSDPFEELNADKTDILENKTVYLQNYSSSQKLFINRGFEYDNNDSLTYCTDSVVPCFGVVYLMNKSGAVITNDVNPVNIFKYSGFYSVLNNAGIYPNQIKPYYTGYAYTYFNEVNDRDTAYVTFLQYNIDGSGCFNDIFPNCRQLKVRYPDINFEEIFAYEENIDSCKARVRRNAEKIARQRYEAYLDEVRTEVLRAYIDQCMQVQEHFNYSFDLVEYHYTLYYYDKAGNLVQTVPPAGVEPLGATAFDVYGNYKYQHEPEHVLLTNYAYNSRNQVVEQYTPDAGKSSLVYNIKGQLVLSQNAQQALDDKFSFTTYDPLGRIVASGQLDNEILPVSVEEGMKDLLFPLAEQYEPMDALEQLTFTLYDNKTLISSVKQDNLRQRVSSSLYTDKLKTLPLVKRYNVSGWGLRTDILQLVSGYGAASVYDYDEIGNVRNLYQNLVVNTPDWQTEQSRKIAYQFSLYSGKVNQVTYDPGTPHSFTHKYRYDADNRIKDVLTQRNGESEYREARYFYYPHGPLSRIEIGEDIVQSIDYAYTLQGWLKTINPDMDNANSINHFIPRNLFHLSLGYHHDDYTNVHNDAVDFLSQEAIDDHNVIPRYGNLPLKYRGLFNGNIAYAMSVIAGLDKTPGISSWQVNEYSYDQLNRIVAAQGNAPVFNTEEIGPDVTGFDKTYRTGYQYDASGNILHLSRTAWDKNTSEYVLMDSLVYHYEQLNNRLKNNRLLHVNDLQSDVALFSEDIDDQGVYSGISGANYTYDAIGNMTRDIAEGIGQIEWNAYGKIKSIQFNNGKPNLTYLYDATGNRIAKLTHSVSNSSLLDKGELYWRDAQGNPLSIEQFVSSKPLPANTLDELKGLEYPIYGSSRIGVRKDLYEEELSSAIISQRGKRIYEHANHLGNVQVTFADFIGPDIDDPVSGEPAALVLNSYDYYPFGMLMPGRQYEKEPCETEDVPGEGKIVDRSEFSYPNSINEWGNKGYFISRMNQLRIGDIKWIDKGENNIVNGAIQITTEPAFFADDSISIGFAMTDLLQVPAGSYRVTFKAGQPDSVDLGFLGVFEKAVTELPEFDLFDGEPPIAGLDSLQEGYNQFYFQLDTITDLVLAAFGAKSGYMNRSIYFDDIIIESVDTLSPPDSLFAVRQDFSDGIDGWKTFDLSIENMRELYREYSQSTATLVMDTLLGITYVYGLENTSDKVVLAQDFQVTSGKTYKIGFTIDSLYGNSNLELKFASKGNILTDTQLRYPWITSEGEYLYEIKANSDILTILFHNNYMPHRDSTIPYFAISDLFIEECHTVNPSQYDEIFTDDFAAGDVSGFSTWRYPQEDYYYVDTPNAMLVVVPYNYEGAVNDSPVNFSSFNIDRYFVFPEKGRYRISFNYSQNLPYEERPYLSFNSVRNQSSSWQFNIDVDNNGLQTATFDVFTDTILFSINQQFRGDTSRRIYLSDFIIEKILSSDSCQQLSIGLIGSGWRSMYWDSTYLANHTFEERFFTHIYFGQLSRDTLLHQLVAKGAFINDILPVDDPGTYAALAKRNLSVEKGKRYRANFDIDFTNFNQLIITGIWKNALTGYIEPTDIQGFEAVKVLSEGGNHTLDFVAHENDLSFEILALGNTLDSTVGIIFKVDNFSLEEVRIDDSTFLWGDGFDTLNADYYSYYYDGTDTLNTGVLSVDSVHGGLKVNLVADPLPDAEPGDYMGIIQKDVILSPDTDYRLSVKLFTPYSQLTGAIAVIRNHDLENVNEMTYANSNGWSSYIFNSGDGILTLATGFFGDGLLYGWVDSIYLEEVSLWDSTLVADDFTTTIEPWKSQFIDGLVWKTGTLLWNHAEQIMTGFPLSVRDNSSLFVAAKEVVVQPGEEYHVSFRLSNMQGQPVGILAGLFAQKYDSVDFSIIEGNPDGYIEAYTADSLLHFTCIPTSDSMTLVLFLNSGEGSVYKVDDLQVYQLKELNIDTIHHFTFVDTNSLNVWRNGFGTGERDTMLLSDISYDTTGGRMRVDMLESLDDNDNPQMSGATYRRLYNLEVGKEYRLQYVLQTDGVSALDSVETVLLRSSLFDIGFLSPDTVVMLSHATDTFSLIFTARESEMIVAINGLKSAISPYHFYLDNFNLQQRWVTNITCPPGNFHYAQEGYRFGFNGQERETELNPSITSAEFWMYDGRLGRRWNVEPLFYDYPNLSPYSTFGNNPILYSDPNGKNPILVIEVIAVAGEIIVGIAATYIIIRERQNISAAIHSFFGVLTYVKEYTPDYDTRNRQREAERSAKLALAMKYRELYAKYADDYQKLNSNFNKDPDDLRSIDRQFLGATIFLGTLKLIDETKDFLKLLIEANNGKIQKIQKEINTIETTTTISSADKGTLIQLYQNVDNLNKENQANTDAIKILDAEMSRRERAITLPTDAIRPMEVPDIKIKTLPIVK